MSTSEKRLTFRHKRMVMRWRLRNKWRRWQHRGAPSYQQGVLDDAAGLQSACRRRKLPCPWCGKGQP